MRPLNETYVHSIAIKSLNLIENKEGMVGQNSISKNVYTWFVVRSRQYK